jgi:hypothetical protein
MPPLTEWHFAKNRRSLDFVVRVAHIPFNGDEFALGIAHDASHVAAELWVVTRQQNEACKIAGTVLLHQGLIAVIAVDLPMGRYWAEIHNASVGLWCFLSLDV